MFVSCGAPKIFEELVSRLLLNDKFAHLLFFLLILTFAFAFAFALVFAFT